MILIRGAFLIDPVGGYEGEYDLLIDRGVVEDVDSPGSFDSASVERIVEAQGKWIFPGLVDVHVHLREPGQEWKETIASGVRAAIRGGYTSVCAMPNTSPAMDNAEVVDFVVRKSKNIGLARVYPIGAITAGRAGKLMAPFREMKDAGAVAFSDDGDPVFDSGIMRRALQYARDLGTPLSCHEEDKCLSCSGAMNESELSFQLGLPGWPKIAEEVMIARDIELARDTGGKVHFCHVTTARGVELIRRAKEDGILVSAEVTPHHLLLTEERVGRYDTSAKMSPPLRHSEDVAALRKGLEDGTIDAVASDHAPHEADSKDKEFSEASMGILGLQTSLPIVMDLVRAGELSRVRAIQVLSTQPASLFGLEACGLRKGAQADVVLYDPAASWKFDETVNESLSRNSPFWGREFTGAVSSVFVAGQEVFHEGVFTHDRTAKAA